MKINEEQREAEMLDAYSKRQHEINQKKDELVSRMSESEKAKMRAIEDAVQILTDAKVRFHFFASCEEEDFSTTKGIKTFTFNKWSYEEDFFKMLNNGRMWFFAAVYHGANTVASQFGAKIVEYIGDVPSAVFKGGNYIQVGDGGTGFDPVNNSDIPKSE